MLLTVSGNATISWVAQIELLSLVPDHILMQLLIYGPLTTVILLSFSSQGNPQYFNQFFTVDSVINMLLPMIIIAILHIYIYIYYLKTCSTMGLTDCIQGFTSYL